MGLKEKIKQAGEKKKQLDSIGDSSSFCMLRGNKEIGKRKCKNCATGGRTVYYKEYACLAKNQPVVIPECKKCVKRTLPTNIKPFTVFEFNLSDRCNLNCDFCYAKEGNPKISGPDINRSIKQLNWFFEQAKPISSRQVLKINIFGGEPLLEWDTFLQLRSHLANKEIKHSYSMGFVTNCTLLDEKKAEYILKNNIPLQMSIDGCKKAQDSTRITKGGGKTSDIVYENAKRILFNKPSWNLRCTIVPRTTQYLVESVDFLHNELGGTNISPVPANGILWTKEDLDFYEEQVFELCDWWMDKIRQGVWIDLFQLQKGYPGLFKPLRKYGCNAGLTMICVDTKNNLWPCHRFANWDPASPVCYGNIDKGGVTNLQFYFEHISSDLRVSKSFGACNECSFALACQEACLYMSMVEGAGHTGGLVPMGRNAIHCRMTEIHWKAFQKVHRTMLLENNSFYKKNLNRLEQK